MSKDLAPRPPDALAQPAARPGFFDGMVALFSGFGFIVGNPGVWLLAIVPVAVALGLTGLLGTAMFELVSGRIAALLGANHGVLAAILKVLAGVLALALALVAGFGLAQPLSGPALNRIVRRVEAKLGAPEWAPTGFAEDMGRALSSIVVSYAFGLPILLLLALVTALFPPASAVTFPLKILVIAILVAWDLCDYPLSIHGLTIHARIAFMKRNAPAMLGFGAALALLSLLPCALVLVLPAGVAGATRLTLAIERAEAARRG